jgi:hypothetical protein
LGPCRRKKFGIWAWDKLKDFRLIFNVEKYLYNSVRNLESFINNCNSFLDESHVVEERAEVVGRELKRSYEFVV